MWTSTCGWPEGEFAGCCCAELGKAKKKGTNKIGKAIAVVRTPKF
jgi:hypothetical protein